jgi:ankyrin repeat protein
MQLMAAGGSPHARNAKGYTPLMIAAESGKKEVIAPLLRAGARREDRSPEGLTALQIALQANRGDDIISLLSAPRASAAKIPEMDVDKILATILGGKK